MKAVINGIQVEGTSEEIAEYQILIHKRKEPIYTSIGSGYGVIQGGATTIEGGTYKILEKGFSPLI